MAARTFTVELERVQKTATLFRVPFDLEDAFGRVRAPEEAKRPETRTRRIASTVARVLEGRPQR